jgi:hypothetical protein
MRGYGRAKLSYKCSFQGTMISQIKPPLSFIGVEVGVWDGKCEVIRSLGHESLVEHYEKIGISEGGEDEDGIWSVSPMSLP